MTRSNIKTKDGRVSAYGFACGYIEAVENGYKHVTIWAEHGAYHVRWQLDKGEPIAKDILNGWRDKEIAAWIEILSALENTHDKVREAADDPDDKYYLELSKNLGTLYVMDNDDYSVVEAYDLWAIQDELEKYGSNWTEADYSSIKEAVR